MIEKDGIKNNESTWYFRIDENHFWITCYVEDGKHWIEVWRTLDDSATFTMPFDSLDALKKARDAITMGPKFLLTFL